MKTLLDQLSDKILVGDDCWEWTGCIMAKTGYGQLRVDGAGRLAHRVMYEFMVGPIPEGFQVDHLCSNRSCVRPAHLEAVTQYENLRRSQVWKVNAEKTHCPHGHPYDEANTYTWHGSRSCKTCNRSYYYKRKAA